MDNDRSNGRAGKFTSSLHRVDKGIFVAVGSNLPLTAEGSPLESCERALRALTDEPVDILARSRWYRSSPVPVSGQPDFVNGVVRVATPLGPGGLLASLHAVEDRLGRTRKIRNEARIIDLDLIAYDGLCREADPSGDGPVLPHPRLEQRAFVLLPLRDIAAGWRHPRSGRTLSDLIADLPAGQRCTALS
ncbi:MAG: 2-amino-4-hydroxy-6-hydroxymethyldihydropteridine diphosphokinase [Defluviicoccus sp.]|nr:2-amino-4-hydroxy-6-hydroxymethyldihydropteridine diphosphokinase [Defluviicoccus sp.]MDE0276459.1 2-amino-4-hydroxy-6-hydroxymethyldihydropteridine diphosphokinase [Defluviicoccus sp.]